jgi:hypothetical protein
MRLGNAIIVPKISPRFAKLQICRCRKKLINSTDSREQYGLLMKGSILKMSQKEKNVIPYLSGIEIERNYFCRQRCQIG